MDRTSPPSDEEDALRCKNDMSDIDIRNIPVDSFLTEVDVREAVKRSMAALVEKVGSPDHLSAFLACNGGSMRKVCLADLRRGCICLVGLNVRKLKWGIDAMLLEFPSRDAKRRRGDYLQAVALFDGDLYVDDIQLFHEEAQLFWETLESSSNPPKRLHVYRRFHHLSASKTRDTGGSQLLETVGRNGKIEVVTVAHSDLMFVSAPAPIPFLQSLTLIDVAVTDEFLEGLAAHLHAWTSLSSLSLCHAFPVEWTEYDRAVIRPFKRGFLTSNNPRLKHLALEGLQILARDQDAEVQVLDFLKLLASNTSLESLSLASLHIGAIQKYELHRLHLQDTVQSLLIDAIEKSELLHLNLQNTIFEDDPAIQEQLRLKNAKHRQLLKKQSACNSSVSVRLWRLFGRFCGFPSL